MENDNNKPSGFKVMDRRRVDERGEDREGGADPSPMKHGPADGQATRSAVSSSDEIEVREDAHDVTFSSFLMSLATQALMQLGQLKPPPGIDLAIDPEAARQTIDIISMLQKKTIGNLDSEEQRLVDEIVHSLRLQFVQGVVK